jgi:hypothetical protein
VGDDAEQRTHGLRRARDVVAGDRHCAARRPQQGGQDLQQGRLACPVGAEQRDRLATAHLEADAVEDGDETEDLADIDDTNDGIEVHPSNRPILAWAATPVKEASRPPQRMLPVCPSE